MQKKEIVINIILATLAAVLLILCIRSVTNEVKSEKKMKEVIEHVRNH